MAGGLITNYINKGSGAPSVAPSVPTGESAYYYDETNGDLYVYNTTSTAWHLALSGVFSGEVSGTDLKATGLTGTALSVRLRGGNASGAPSTGTGVVRDLAVNSDGSIYICTVAGSPGTWTAVSGGGGSSTFAGDTDVSISGLANLDQIQYQTGDSKYHNVAGGMVRHDANTLSVSAASVTLTPKSGYSSLVIYYQARDTGAGTGGNFSTLRFNADTGSNYDYSVDNWGSSGTDAPGDGEAQTSMQVGITMGGGNAANYASSGLIQIPNYAGTTFYKSVTAAANLDVPGSPNNPRKLLFAGLWRSTTAITSITITSSSGSFAAGSSFQLYGLA